MPRRRRPSRWLTAVAVPLSVLAAPPSFPAAVAVAAAAPQEAAAPAEATITVTVDGQPVAFAGQGPVLHPSGSVLVPLRGVFERLGAGVAYAKDTKTVTAVKGDLSVALRIGDPTAYVNNQPRPLTVAPALVNGSTLVPLRFVSEALGAQVKWDAAAQTVAIVAPRAIDTSPVIGTVSAVDAAARTVAVRPVGADADVTVSLIPDAALLSKTGDATAVVADLSALRAGDLVTIKRNDKGEGFSLEAAYAEAGGAVKAVDAAPVEGAPKLTLADDTAVEIAPNAPVTRGAETITLADIKPGQKVALRLNPQTRRATAVSVEVPKVEIASVTHSAGERLLKAGDEVTVTVTGTPGAKVAFTVSGVPALIDRPLTESAQTPGTYAATFPVPGGVAVEKATLFASLSLAELSAGPTPAAAALAIDAAAPLFEDLTPAHDANTTARRPRISATFRDEGSGVDQTATRLFVAGKDVTAQAKVEKGFFLYEPPADLPAGETAVVLVARDRAGNEARREWGFTVTPIVSPLKVVTLVDVPEDRPLGSGETFKVRAEAAPGGSARFAVGKEGVIAGSLYEEKPGLYVGSYTVKKGTALTRQPVTVTFVPGGGEAKEWTLAAIQTLTIRAGAPRPPVIDLPAEQSSTGRYVTISGRGTPNTKVRLNVSYNGKVFLIGSSAGGGLRSVELPVGADGTWKSEVIDLSTSRELNGVTFTATAVTVAPDGDASEAATVRFKR